MNRPEAAGSPHFRPHANRRPAPGADEGKPCPAPRCRRRIHANLFCCVTHWKGLSDYHRDMISDVFIDYRNEVASAADKAGVEAGVLRDSGWSDEDAIFDYKTFSCPCGTKCLLAGSPHGTVPVREVVIEDEKKSLGVQLVVLIGFRVFWAREHPGPFAKFVVHTCPAAVAAYPAAGEHYLN